MSTELSSILANAMLGAHTTLYEYMYTLNQALYHNYYAKKIYNWLSLKNIFSLEWYLFPT